MALRNRQPLRKQLAENRSLVVFAVLVAGSIASLAVGAHGSIVESALRNAVGLGSYPFLVAVDFVEDRTARATTFLFEYRKIQRENRQLRQALAETQDKLVAAEEQAAEVVRLEELLEFRRRRAGYELVPANVLQHAQGVLTIDRGAIHGIRESMCVITPDGIVGLVANAGPFTSNVLTLQSNDCKVDAMVRSTRVRGRIHGTGNDLNAFCVMHYIDLKDDVREGDIVVTSPDSVFPPGYNIGRVVSTPNRGQLAQSAEVLPAVDPYRLDEVLVLTSAAPDPGILAGVRDELVSELNAENLIDIASIQERFAP